MLLHNLLCSLFFFLTQQKRRRRANRNQTSADVLYYNRGSFGWMVGIVSILGRYINWYDFHILQPNYYFSFLTVSLSPAKQKQKNCKRSMDWRRASSGSIKKAYMSVIRPIYRFCKISTGLCCLWSDNWFFTLYLLHSVFIAFY